MSGKPQRLIALLAVLQVRRVTTAEALAAEFGVSVRTILRDIQALIDADIPVLTERGKYGGISLLPGSQADLSGLTSAGQRDSAPRPRPGRRRASSRPSAVRHCAATRRWPCPTS
jgi:biotin operon repressor